jgi:hypothetical protein
MRNSAASSLHYSGSRASTVRASSVLKKFPFVDHNATQIDLHVEFFNDVQDRVGSSFRNNLLAR